MFFETLAILGFFEYFKSLEIITYFEYLKAPKNPEYKILTRSYSVVVKASKKIDYDHGSADLIRTEANRPRIKIYLDYSNFGAGPH